MIDFLFRLKKAHCLSYDIIESVTHMFFLQERPKFRLSLQKSTNVSCPRSMTCRQAVPRWYCRSLEYLLCPEYLLS